MLALTEPFRVLFLLTLGAWIGVLSLSVLGIALLTRRLGRDDAWPALRTLAPLGDLVGTWAGVIAAAALFLGRRGYGFSWAAALFLVALMVTASLYDRAVLMPSLDAAWKRLRAGTDEAKWEADWRFLWRMADWTRVATLAMGAAALVFGLLA